MPTAVTVAPDSAVRDQARTTANESVTMTIATSATTSIPATRRPSPRLEANGLSHAWTAMGCSAGFGPQASDTDCDPSRQVALFACDLYCNDRSNGCQRRCLVNDRPDLGAHDHLRFKSAAHLDADGCSIVCDVAARHEQHRGLQGNADEHVRRNPDPHRPSSGRIATPACADDPDDNSARRVVTAKTRATADGQTA